MNIGEQSIDSSECIVHNGNNSFIDGIAKLDNRLIIILNTQNLIPLYDHSLKEDDTHEVMQGEQAKVLNMGTPV